MIVVGLQVMARNERRKVLGVSEALSEQRRKPAGCAETGAKSGAKFRREMFFCGRAR